MNCWIRQWDISLGDTDSRLAMHKWIVGEWIRTFTSMIDAIHSDEHPWKVQALHSPRVYHIIHIMFPLQTITAHSWWLWVDHCFTFWIVTSNLVLSQMIFKINKYKTEDDFRDKNKYKTEFPCYLFENDHGFIDIKHILWIFYFNMFYRFIHHW